MGSLEPDAPTAEDMNGVGLIVLIVAIAAICGALVGIAAAEVLGIVLWPTLALSLARYAYAVVAGVIQGGIMWAYGHDAFDTSVQAAIVGIGAAVIAVVIASRRTAAMLVQLSRSPSPDRARMS